MTKEEFYRKYKMIRNFKEDCMLACFYLAIDINPCNMDSKEIMKGKLDSAKKIMEDKFASFLEDYELVLSKYFKEQ